jgi:sugar phosphate isomerase/epimerase
MRDDIQTYARLGLVHFMLWPNCLADAELHSRTLRSFVSRDDMETIDCFLPYGRKRREELIRLLRGCGKELRYFIHAFPLDKICLGSTSDSERGLIRLVLGDQIEVAAAIGAKSITFGSGVDPGNSNRAATKEAFADFCRWFCGRLKDSGMTALLEPFDRTSYRRFLYGPTKECVELIDCLAPSVDNLQIQLDIAHVVLSGETFREAIETVSGHLGHVHLGNCVKKDASDPFYGDKHPAIGYPDGEIDVPELVEVLRALLESGYLSKENRGSLAIEMQPLPGLTAEETIQDSFSKLEQAWQMI